LLDARGHFTGDALDFYLEVRRASPHEQVVFLVGPPTYLSLAWPGEVFAEDASSGQWGATVRRFLAA
jgi:hypothetical protein